MNPTLDLAQYLDRVTLVLSYDCNLDCPYCGLHALPLSSATLDLEEWDRVISDIVRIVGADVPFFVSGGEPTYHFPELCYILKTVRKFHAKTALVTNGLLLDTERLTQIAGLLDALQVTCHLYFLSSGISRRTSILHSVELLTRFRELREGPAVLSVNVAAEGDLDSLSLALETVSRTAQKPTVEVAVVGPSITDTIRERTRRIVDQYASQAEVLVLDYTGPPPSPVREIVVSPDGYVLPSEKSYRKLGTREVAASSMPNVRHTDLEQALRTTLLKSHTHG